MLAGWPPLETGFLPAPLPRLAAACPVVAHDVAPATSANKAGDDEEEERNWLDDAALATRLAKFLWNGPPDAELLALAARRELHRPGVLRVETERMLEHSRSREFVKLFLEHWLELRDLASMRRHAPPCRECDASFQAIESLVADARAHFTRVLDRNLPVSALTSSPLATSDERLGSGDGSAEHLKTNVIGKSAAVLRLEPGPLARHLVHHLFGYAIGSPLSPSDRAVIDDILARSKIDDCRLRTLIHEIVQSERFQRQ